MKYAEIEWRDGQPYSPLFDDIYFSNEGGRDESSYVFLQQNNLPERWQGRQRFTLAETGFGTGLNFVLTLKSWLETTVNESCLHYVAIEKYPVNPGDIRRLAESWPDLKEYFEALLEVYPLPVEGSHSRRLFGGRVYLHFVFMDVQAALCDHWLSVDAWYLDGFDPAKNPEIFSEDIFQLIAQNSNEMATLSTFSCAGKVRRGLASAGFEVKKVPGFGRKREMLAAVLHQTEKLKSKTPWFELPDCVVSDKTAIVIGAGIAGLTAAWSLVQRGWQVTVLDKHQHIAQEASGNSAGLVLPRLSADNDADALFYSSAFLYAAQQLDQLQQYSAETFWFRSGVFSSCEAGNADKIIQRYAYPDQYMMLPAATALPAYLRDKAGGIVSFAGAGWVRPAEICNAILHACGGALKFRTLDVATLERNADGWDVLAADGKTMQQASVVIIANGIGVNAFDQTSWLPVSSIRGQITLVPATKKSAQLEHALSLDAYITPQHNEHHCVGATYSYINTSTELQQADQDKNLDCLDKELPGMFERPGKLDGRVGFRAVSADRVPVVGAVPDINAFQNQYADLHHGRTNVEYENGKYLDGLYVSAAHGSRGLCSSFLSAEIIASMIENTPLPAGRVVVDHLNPARFLIRYLRRNRKKP